MESPHIQLNTTQKLTGDINPQAGKSYAEVSEELRSRKVDPKNPADVVWALRLVEQAHKSMEIDESAEATEFGFELEDSVVLTTVNCLTHKGKHYFEIDSLGDRTIEEKRIVDSEKQIIVSRESRFEKIIDFGLGYGMVYRNSPVDKKLDLELVNLNTREKYFIPGISEETAKELKNSVFDKPAVKIFESYDFHHVFAIHPGADKPEEFVMHAEWAFDPNSAVVANGKVYMICSKDGQEIVTGSKNIILSELDCKVFSLKSRNDKLNIVYQRRSKQNTWEYVYLAGGKEKVLFDYPRRISEADTTVVYYDECGYFTFNGVLYNSVGDKITTFLKAHDVVYQGQVGGHHCFAFYNTTANKLDYYLDENGEEINTANIRIDIGKKSFCVKKQAGLSSVEDFQGHRIGEHYQDVRGMRNINNQLYFIADKRNNPGQVINEKGQSIAGTGNLEILTHGKDIYFVKGDVSQDKLEIYKGDQSFLNLSGYEIKWPVEFSFREIKGELYVTWYNRDKQEQWFVSPSGDMQSFNVDPEKQLPKNSKFVCIQKRSSKYYFVDNNFEPVKPGYDEIFETQVVGNDVYVLGRKWRTIVREKVD